MTEFVYKNEFLEKYVEYISLRAESDIPRERYHLGKLILQGLKADLDFVAQIDGGTGESETNASVLKRSVQCATSFKNMGLKTGDVMILMAPNHLDQAIPFYAALYLGIAVAPIDRMLGVYELKTTFDTDKPKIIFCQSERVQDVQKAVELSGLEAKIISFDQSEHTISFSEMIEKYGEKVDVQDFKVTDFDPEVTIAFLVSTSGTTGLPKAVIHTHKNIVIAGPYALAFSKKFPTPVSSVLIVAPLLWLSALVNYFLSPYLKYTRVQTSRTLTPEHALDIIGKYKPAFLVISPTMMTTWLKAVNREIHDLSSFEVILVGGSAVPSDLVEMLQDLAPNALVADGYGMSELGSSVFNSVGVPVGSCGIRFSHIEYKLVNIESGEEITESNRSGELWMRGPNIAKGYYNNPEATAEAFTKDGWFKTGDMMYRDENWRFYYVERIKLLLKYRNYQISPVEVETVIRKHPGVLDVAVTGIPDAECGDLPCACVVPRPGATLTEQEIKDLVKEKLTDTKQLRGGVIFLKELPLTTSTKINRRKLKEMVIALAKKQ